MAVCEETNRRINRNRDYKETFKFSDRNTSGNKTPRDLTGHEFILELKKTVNAPPPTLVTLTSNPAAGIVVLSPQTDGIIEVTITAIQSATFPSGVFPFDLYQITPAGDKTTAISGFMSVHDSTAI